MIYKVPRDIVTASFMHFRKCGAGRRECQVLWLSSWSNPQVIGEVVHPKHGAHIGGFEVDTNWLNRFWVDLADRQLGIRIQVHTHPEEAFHSITDDSWPIVHTVGFLSLVIPNFALGPIGFENAFLAEIDESGHFREAPINQRLALI